ncbi:MAG TPA: tripartite tricarboxylate transporter substrate-binding protein [Usitatibacter sp.]|nr:tripartite tricarboxylate transporter substrate-binding protein [Usitatibacter sp.]
MGEAREGARHQGGVGRIATRFIVPFGRDGAADRAARAFADAFGGVEVENLPGEGGLAGVRCANSLAAEARGAVLLLGTPTTHILLPARSGRDAAPDAAFAPLAGLGSAPNVLLVSPRLGVATVDELLARARKETLLYASAGAGQTIHVCTEYLCALAGVRMMHRPYDSGSATAYGDLAAGRVHVYFDNLLGCRDFVARGDALALAVSATARNRILPDVPTLAECGFPDHALEIGFGVFGAGLDESQASRLETVRADPDLAEALERIGLSGGVMRANALAQQVEASAAAWRAALVAAIGA